MSMKSTQIIGVLSVVVSTLLLFSATVFAATYYVPDHFGTIQAALDGATDGDEIIVRDGTYTGAGNKNLSFLGKALTLRSENGPENCIIDCEQDGRGFYFHSWETAASILDGFTVTNGFYGWGVGIRLSQCSPTITNCIISGNSEDIAIPERGAGGIYITRSSSIISNCIISKNTGKGIHIEAGNPTISNCMISENTGAGISGGLATISNCIISGNMAGGIGRFEVTNDNEGRGIPPCGIISENPEAASSWIRHEISNCVVVGNSGVRGGGIIAGGGTLIANCTIIGNSASEFGGGVWVTGACQAMIRNSIIRDNSAPLGPEIALTSLGLPECVDSSSLNISRSNVSGGLAMVYQDGISELEWGIGMIDADPLFVGEGDFHLSDGSPCIDTGTHVDLDTDMDGSPRPQGLGYDMGVFERAYSGPCAASVGPDAPPVSRIGAEGTIEVKAPDTCEWTAETTDGWIILSTGHSGTGNGAVEYLVQPNTTHSPRTGTITIGGDIFMVNQKRGAGDTYYVPDDFPTIRQALDAVLDADTIIVRDGTYTGIWNKDLDFLGKEITLRSENGPENCIIDCEGDGRGFYFHSGETVTSVLDGFTITGGLVEDECAYPNPGPLAASAISGGGILCLWSSPLIRNCIIEGNYADRFGGGICFGYSSALVTGCTIANNTADIGDGGGIFASTYYACPYNPFVSTHASVVKCIIRDNLARRGTGGVCADAGISIADCIITGNEGGHYGGLTLYGLPAFYDADIVNCLITGNSGGGMMVGSGTTVRNCTISGNSPSGTSLAELTVFGLPDVSNSIIWGTGFFADIYVRGGNLSIGYSDVRNGLDGVALAPGATLNWGDGMIAADPLFVGSGDYYLTADSPCINAGTDAGVYADIDGDTRPDASGRFDMGADEYYPADAPRISVAPAALSSTCAIGTNGSDLSFDVWNSGVQPLVYSISDDADWLQCLFAAGVSTGEVDTVPVQFPTSALDLGKHSATITVSDPDAPNNPQTISVDIFVVPPPEILLSTQAFENTCEFGTNASDQAFSVWNSGEYPLSYSISDDVDWLQCRPATGTSVGEQDTITAYYTTAGLDVGRHTATITVEDPNATNSPQEIDVTLEVIYIPDIAVSPSSLTHSCEFGEDAPQQTFYVWNSGTGTLSYSISDDTDWVECSPTSGTSASEADTITIDYDTSSLGAGDYSAIITIDDPGADNNPQYVTVLLTVIPNDVLSQIDLRSPANGSILQSPPTFTWGADGGADNRYAVDLAFSVYGPWYSTWENLHQEITGTGWTMPQGMWNKIHSGTYIYWRVRGEDFGQAGLNIVYAGQLWWFYKP
jgi:parallel beta-helix repeat protein